MAVSAEEFLIKLTQQVSGPAAQATGALAKLEAQIKKEEAALAGLESKLGTARAKLSDMMGAGGGKPASLAAIEKQRAAIASLERAMSSKKGDLGKLAGGKDAAKAIDAQGSAIDKIIGKKAALKGSIGAELANIGNAAKDVGGPIGALASKIESVAAIAGKIPGAAGAMVVLVAVLTAVAAAAIAAAAAMTKFALAAADAARSARLFNVGAAGGAAKGAELTMIIDQIAGKVPLARAEIEAFGRALALMGINGRRLQVALEMISAIESVVPGAGAKIQGLVERFQKLRRAVLTKADLEGTGLALVDVAAQLAKGMGITQAAALRMLQNGTAGVDKVLDAMRKAVEQKFGKTLAAQMMGLQVQWQKLQENIAGLFAKIDLEAFLGGLKMITDLFSQNTVMGRVLKEVIGSAFTGVFNMLAKLAPFVVAFFKGFAIGALQVYIAIKPLGQAIAALFGKTNKGDAMKAALEAGAVAAHALGIGIRFAMGLVLFGINAFRFLYGVVSEAPATFSKFVAGFMMIPNALFALAGMAAAAGGGLIQGLIQGIMGGIGAAMAAVATLGASIESALRNAIGWHSPATLGVDAAGAIGDGFSQEAGAQEGKTSKAAEGMIQPKAAKDAAKVGKGGGRWVYIENFYGSRENLTELRGFLGGEFEFMGRT